ncbi:MAG: hypothetical protein R3D57_15845 [Hyphomicrobiaceae bacterium]
MQQGAIELPALRQELRLLPGPAGRGEPGRLIYDPIRHRYFQISVSVFELLKCWKAGPAGALIDRAEASLQRPVTEGEVMEIAKFLIVNQLTEEPPKGDAVSLAKQEQRLRRSLLSRIVHGYLFFRIPLVRPARFFKATLPLVDPLFSKATLVVVLVLTAAGLYFASRQWDAFVGDFLDLLSIEGALYYGSALVLVKACHELAHGYTATRLGVRVNTMGIAFMVMMPLLYTDVTDAWRLRSRREKLAIDAAGIIVELAIAGIATLLWVFLPEGPMRTAVFVLATTSWIMSLAVNLNPLMRFDGYFLLADAWQIPNLWPRSNAMAQWWLRETLFSLGEAAPEAMPPRRRRLMIGFAISVWVYRFFLFLGIALLVYAMFFKLLGIVLFVIEITWFILLPVGREFQQWWRMRKRIIGSRRSLVTAGVLVAVATMLIIPWSGTISLQAVAFSSQEAVIYGPRPAEVVAVGMIDGAEVDEGDMLVTLRAPDLAHEMAQTRKQIDLVRLRLDRIAGDVADRSNRIVLEGELSRHRTHLTGLETEASKLIVRSPQSGVARDVDWNLQPGQWIDQATPIGRVIGSGAVEIQGYLGEDEFWRISEGADATFVPEDPALSMVSGQVFEVVQTGARSITLAYLSSVYGGAIASDRDADNEIRPRSGRHLVRVRSDGELPARAVRGTLRLSGQPESFAAAIWRRVLQVLVRESGA